jgi:hypothetical protein
MVRNHIRITLALLIVGLITLGSVTLQPAIPYSVPRFTHLETPLPDDTPAPVVARGFDGDGPVGLGLLDQRAEVLFDN